MNAKAYIASLPKSDVYLGKIAQVEKILLDLGKTERRSWYEAFAGTKTGQPRIIHGVEFPIIPEIRERQHLAKVKGIKPTKRVAPPAVPQNRWKSHSKSV